MPRMSESGLAQLRSLKREGSVRASVPPQPPDQQVWLCSYTKSGNALAFESRLVVRKHTCTLGWRPAADLATRRPRHLSAKNNQNTHTHTLLFNYWYCIDLDVFAGTKKLNSSLDLWTLNVWLPELGAAFRNHDVTVMLVNPPPEWPFSASHTRWCADVTSVFKLLFFPAGEPCGAQASGDAGNAGFPTKGSVSVSVVVDENAPSYLRRRGGICSRVTRLPSVSSAAQPSLKATRSPQRLPILTHKNTFLLQTASTKQLKQDFILWLIQMQREQVQLIFITHAKILIFWVTPKFSPVW